MDRSQKNKLIRLQLKWKVLDSKVMHYSIVQVGAFTARQLAGWSVRNDSHLAFCNSKLRFRLFGSTLVQLFSDSAFHLLCRLAQLPSSPFPGLKAWRTFLIIKNLHSLRELGYHPDDGSRGVLYPAPKAFSSSPGFSFCFFNFNRNTCFGLTPPNQSVTIKRKKEQERPGTTILNACVSWFVRLKISFNSSVQPLLTSLLYKRGV